MHKLKRDTVLELLYVIPREAEETGKSELILMTVRAPWLENDLVRNGLTFPFGQIPSTLPKRKNL